MTRQASQTAREMADHEDSERQVFVDVVRQAQASAGQRASPSVGSQH